MNRWTILAVLFFVRLTMAFQFQTVAALSPILIETAGLSLSQIGLLIGLYLAPGVIVALPGGSIAARFGEKRIVALSIVVMLIGGGLVAADLGWWATLAGRGLSGAGGIVINVVLTKMLVDWFAGREIATAMGLFITSWPFGIALALVVLPLAASTGGLALARLVELAIVALGLVLFLALYRAPEQTSAPTASLRPAGPALVAVCLAGLVWAFYNSALAMVFGFGPALLAERGWSIAAAGSATSTFMWVFALAAPLGGILADRTGRRDMVIALSLLSFVVLMPLILVAGPWGVTTIFVVAGVLFALCAGPIMTLPSSVLAPGARIFGMGVFFTLYYVVMMIAPRVAGGLADATGRAATAILLGVVLSLASVAMLGLFRRASAVAQRSEATGTA